MTSTHPTIDKVHQGDLYRATYDPTDGTVHVLVYISKQANHPDVLTLDQCPAEVKDHILQTIRKEYNLPE